MQVNRIRDLINNIVEKEYIGGMDKRKAYQKWHIQLQKKMGVSSYLLIKKEDFQKAIDFLSKANTLKRSKTRRKDNIYWRSDIYKSIYARAKQLEISKEEILDIVYKRYGKKIKSLKELGEQNLDKLRIYIYSIKK